MTNYRSIVFDCLFAKERNFSSVRANHLKLSRKLCLKRNRNSRLSNDRMLHRVSTCFSFFSVVKWVAKTARKPHITTLSVLSSLSPFFIFLVYFVSFTSFHHVFRESVYVFSGLVQYINWGEGVHTRKNVWGPCHLNNVLYTHTHTSWITRYRPHTHVYKYTHPLITCIFLG